ncbi:hypothetical protein [Chitinophaga sp. YIM B06452]|uniref:hypothetical protein n=1 Tax=Chitinophaga sp. YIM B06452 TaxID=3082158 RepID=UPI0031FE5B97
MAAQDTPVGPVNGGLSSEILVDERFLGFLNEFKAAVVQKDVVKVQSMISFPLPTAPKPSDDGLTLEHDSSSTDKIKQPEFMEHYGAIFTSDILRLLPMASLDNIEVIDDNADDYYRRLQSRTDSGKVIYEVYIQYPEKNETADSFFGLVFGQVEGEFKMISYYAKWPVVSE